MSFMILGPNKDNNNTQSNITNNKKYPFSKVLLIQESILIWLITICCIAMAFICIFTGSFVELPWITAMVGCPWAAYAITQNAYYKKSMIENSQGGIVYDGLFGTTNPDIAGEEAPADVPVG